MPHDDQFTATGPAFTGAGFPRAAFSTGRLGTDSTYGVNVQGSECGVYGESRPGLPQGELGTTRTTVKGTGVCGIGANVGVSGEGTLAGVRGVVKGGSDKSGVVGSNFNDGPGVAGFSHSSLIADSLGTGIGVVGASNKGAGVVGLSKRNVVLRDENSGGGVVIPDQNTDVGGEGTGVIGASGSGTGVEGVSNSGAGVVGRSNSGVGAFFTSLDSDAVVGRSGGPGDGVRGTSGSGNGVKGESDAGVGVFGDSKEQSGVVGRCRGDFAPGVFGTCDKLSGVAGRSKLAPGVFGDSTEQAGVAGRSSNSSGVFGFSEAGFKIPAPAGVFGVNDKSVGVLGSSVEVIGVWGNSDKGLGVIGTANFGAGAPTEKITDQGIGVIGLANSGVGVAGMSTAGTGVFGSSATGLAGHFKGPVTIEGDVTIIGGTKSAAVPHPDGSHKQLYCMESPESWFEDFGEAQLVDGKGDVQLDPDFAALVDMNGYYVFLTPYGESNGMFVAERYATGFRVCEQQGGTSNVSFAYRVVAKRKDVVANRLATVRLPEAASELQLPDLRLKISPPDFERLSVNLPDLPDSETD